MDPHMLVYSNSQVKSIVFILKTQICPKAMDANKGHCDFEPLK